MTTDLCSGPVVFEVPKRQSGEGSLAERHTPLELRGLS